MPGLGDLLLETSEEIFQRNAPYVRQGDNRYNTNLGGLGDLRELAFRQWVQDNRVPFNPDAQVSDYDMRGFYQGLGQLNPHAATAINPNDQQIHYPDYWKTPYHQSFSQDSQWATPVAPQWNEVDQLIAPSGRIVFDERKKNKN